MRSVLLILGYLLVISALFRIIPITAAIYYGEPFIGFMATLALSAAMGALLIFFARRGKEELTIDLESALLTAAASFIIIPMIGAITYLGDLGNYLDALFESVSGFTTTGLSVYPSLENVSKSTILWRAQTQWMGGLGIIIIFLFIFSRTPTHSVYAEQQKVASGKSLYAASGYPEGVGPSFSVATRRLIILYLGLTLLGISILIYSGISIFESTALTFSALSTGGFGVGDDFSFNGLQIFSLSIIMLFGALPFNLYAAFVWERSKEIFRNIEVLSFLAMFSVLFLLGSWVAGDAGIASFQILSALTTTGFSIVKVADYQPFFMFLLLLAMFAGGCTASTAGGVKQVRVLIMLKSVYWAVRKAASPPSEVINLRLSGRIIGDRELLLVQIFIVMNGLALTIGVFSLMYLGYSMQDSVFLSLSALGTVGLSPVPLYSMPLLGKIVLIFEMLLGRLEFFPLLLLLRNIVQRASFIGKPIWK